MRANAYSEEGYFNDLPPVGKVSIKFKFTPSLSLIDQTINNLNLNDFKDLAADLKPLEFRRGQTQKISAVKSSLINSKRIDQFGMDSKYKPASSSF